MNVSRVRDVPQHETRQHTAQGLDLFGLKTSILDGLYAYNHIQY